MQSLDTIEAFVKVVQASSFSGAARELSIPKSTLSRKITRLEDRLGVQLLVRTTRKLSLTDIGAAYFERCRQIVQDLEEAEDMVRMSHAQPRGILRITAPVLHEYSVFAEVILKFMEQCPEVELDILFTNRYVDLIEEGYDVALRGGRLEDSSMIARKIASTNSFLVASPAYLARRGTPQTLQEIAEHDCLLRADQPLDRWFDVHGNSVKVKGRLRTNDIDMLRHAALAGLGLVLLPGPTITHDLKAKNLIPVLPELMNQPSGFYAVYPASRHLSVKVRAFVDFIAGSLGEVLPNFAQDESV